MDTLFNLAALGSVALAVGALGGYVAWEIKGRRGRNP